MRMMTVSSNEYQVFDDQKNILADLDKKECSCGKWRMTDISCRYVILYVQNKRLNIKDLCDLYYNVETFRKVYSVIHLLLEVDLDP